MRRQTNSIAFSHLIYYPSEDVNWNWMDWMDSTHDVHDIDATDAFTAQTLSNSLGTKATEMSDWGHNGLSLTKDLPMTVISGSDLTRIRIKLLDNAYERLIKSVIKLNRFFKCIHIWNKNTINIWEIEWVFHTITVCLHSSAHSLVFIRVWPEIDS